MREIVEVSLPGVGVRQEFISSTGQRVTVVSHRGGRREISVFRRDDPDASASVLDLDPEDAAALSIILGAPQVAATAAAMQQLEGLALDGLTVAPKSPATGATIGAGQYRSRTGASIVAVIRNQETFPTPRPDFVFAAGDVAVAVGTAEGLAKLRDLLRA